MELNVFLSQDDRWIIDQLEFQYGIQRNTYTKLVKVHIHFNYNTHNQ
jgi:hypothetical protein